jgi:H+/gluconate symporter-like permease
MKKSQENLSKMDEISCYRKIKEYVNAQDIQSAKRAIDQLISMSIPVNSLTLVNICKLCNAPSEALLSESIRKLVDLQKSKPSGEVISVVLLMYVNCKLVKQAKEFHSTKKFISKRIQYICFKSIFSIADKFWGTHFHRIGNI